MKNKLKIFFYSPFDLLRPRTNQISDIRFCEGFLQNGAEILYTSPLILRSENIEKKQVHELYGVDKRLNIRILPTFFRNEMNQYRFVVYIVFLVFFQTVDFLKAIAHSEKVVFLSRNIFLLIFPYLLKKIVRVFNYDISVVYWAHDFKKGKIYKYLYPRLDFVFATNSSILNAITQFSGRRFSQEHITFNPISEDQKDYKISKTEARKKLGLSEKKIALYTGKLYIGQKEIEYIVEVAKKINDVQFIFTGGYQHVVDFYRSKYISIDNIHFTGFINDYTTIIDYQIAADALISYYTDQDHQLEFNLPQKIGEYMLSGNPIISPDFHATQDLLTNENCFFAQPNSSEDLEKAVRAVFQNQDLALEKSEKAKKIIYEITFKKRTKIILNKLHGI